MRGDDVNIGVWYLDFSRHVARWHHNIKLKKKNLYPIHCHAFILKVHAFIRDLYMQNLQLEVLVVSASDEFLDGPIECIFAADGRMRVPLQRGLVHAHQYTSWTFLPSFHSILFYSLWNFLRLTSFANITPLQSC